MRLTFAIPLVAPVLLAQVPVPTPGQKAAEDAKAIQALKAERPQEAFDRARALLPSARPPFDRASLQTTFAGIREWNGHLDLYRAAYDAGVACGRFEETREVAQKGRDMARDLQKEAMAAFGAYKATWDKAAEESAQALQEMKDLEKKVAADKANPVAPPKPDPKLSVEEANALLLRHAEQEQQKAAEVQRLAFLRSNEGTLKENIEKAKSAMTPLERTVRDLETRAKGFEDAVAQWDKYLKEESEDIAAKYKGDKAVYAAGLLRGVAPKPDNVDAALVALHRAAVLDPRNAAIQKRIAQLTGKAPAPAAPKAKGGKR
jgi:hypothetical protein